MKDKENGAKELFIIWNNPRRPVLLWRKTEVDSRLPEGCWTPPQRIEYYHIDWKPAYQEKPFISDVTGGTILDFDLFFLKLCGKIRRPTARQIKVIEDYEFFAMLWKFEQERVDAGWLSKVEKSIVVANKGRIWKEG